MLTQKNGDPLGFIYICEQTSPSLAPIGVKTMNNGVFFVEFEAILQTFDVENRNKRYYDKNNVWNMIANSEKIQSCLADNAWLGERNHPLQRTKDAPLTDKRVMEPDMENISHVIKNPHMVGNELHATIQSYAGSEVGIGFGKAIVQGLHPAFSARAIAHMEVRNGKPYIIMTLLITYDWVIYPSHKEAHIVSAPKIITKPIYTESVEESHGTSFEDAYIPVETILQDIGKTDINVQTVMESFNIPMENIVGFSNSKKHVIVQDGMNQIFVNMRPESKSRMDDFFGSF